MLKFKRIESGVYEADGYRVEKDVTGYVTIEQKRWRWSFSAAATTMGGPRSIQMEIKIGMTPNAKRSPLATVTPKGTHEKESHQRYDAGGTDRGSTILSSTAMLRPGRSTFAKARVVFTIFSRVGTSRSSFVLHRGRA
jgi:hypothetical protein